MYAGQKIVASDNKEVLLFPMDCMYITQGENGSISHSLAMDFVGWTNETGQINHYPYYAPCSIRCVAKNYNNGQAYVIWESLNVVHFVDGSIDYVNFVVMHDDNPLYNVGDTLSQGDLLGRTGSSGFATGDHLHLNVSKGIYQGWQSLGNGFSELINSMSIYNAMYVNDTTLYVDYGYNWQTYDYNPEPPDPPDPPTPVKNKINAFKKYYFSNKKLKKLY